MAGISFTDHQRAAIEAPSGNILVSAAAGSGKTAVLTERVIRLMTQEHPVAADRLVIVTFTVLASAEMRSRIEQRLNELLEAEPDNEWLQTQRQLLPNARIGTIHSLCGALLRDHFQLLDLPAAYRIAEDSELNSLHQDLLEQLLERCYADADEDFLELADMLAGNDDRLLGEMVLGLYHWVRCYPFPESVLTRLEALYDSEEPFEQTPWCVLLCGWLEQMAEQCAGWLRWSLEQAGTDEVLAEKYCPAIQHDLDTVEVIRQALADRDWERACAAAAGYQKQRLGQVRGHARPDWLKEIQASRNRACECLQKEMLAKYLSVDSAAFAADRAFLRGPVHMLFELVRELLYLAEMEKKERGILDFSDLEHYALRLLVREEDGCYRKTQQARQLGEQYDEIMVDECQDINQLQNLIFWALSRGAEEVPVGSDELLTQCRGLFLVGDVKQSIYRFRNAMPGLFTRRKKLFSPAPDAPSRVILLQENFRSRPQVTDAVNQVFSALMTEEVGELRYDEGEALVASATYHAAQGCEAECHFLSLAGESAEEAEDDFSAEAGYIGRLIRSMIQRGQTVEDHGVQRPCTWRDFCVLLRTKKGKTSAFTEKLKQQGIPCYAEAGQGYFDAFEVSVMLSLLRVIDNPMLDVDLLTVMLSPMFLFTADDLARIRLADRKAPLYTAVVKTAEEGDTACREFLEQLSRLREQAVVLPASRLIQLIYDQTGFLFVVESMVSGEQKRANLRLLLSYAEHYEAAGSRGLPGFLRFVQRAIDRGEDFVCANTASERADVVRIMTIHGSKGLEFPICILADTSKKFNLTDLNQSWLVHPEYGFGMKIRKPETFQNYSTLPWEAIRLVQKREALSEEMRVLYVAMTRAREKLVVVASGQKLMERCRQNLEAAQGGLKALTLLSRQSVSDWLVLSFAGYPEFCQALESGAGEAQAGAWRCLFPQLESSYARQEESLRFSAEPDTKILRFLNEAIGFAYPDEALQAVPAKVTVTQIAKARQGEALAELEPMELREEQLLDGARRGTILHSFMQYADFAAAKQDLEAEITRLVDRGFLNGQESKALNRRTIRAFLESGLLERMMASPHLEREYQFLYEIPAGEVDETLKPPFSEERILLQGIADAVFEENGELVIVDYKTDRMERPEDFIRKYAGQLRIYQAAMEQYFGVPVRECLIYSLHLGREIRVR